MENGGPGKWKLAHTTSSFMTGKGMLQSEETDRQQDKRQSLSPSISEMMDPVSYMKSIKQASHNKHLDRCRWISKRNSLVLLICISDIKESGNWRDYLHN